MTPEQKMMVQDSFAKVAPIAETAADIFYSKLFELDPELKPLFKGDMVEQGKKLMQVLATAVAGLDNLESLLPVVQALGKRHAAYGVVDEHYATVAEALLYALEQGLGEDFTPEVKAAWVEVYGILAEVMTKAAAEAA